MGFWGFGVLGFWGGGPGRPEGPQGGPGEAVDARIPAAGLPGHGMGYGGGGQEGRRSGQGAPFSGGGSHPQQRHQPRQPRAPPAGTGSSGRPCPGPGTGRSSP